MSAIFNTRFWVFSCRIHYVDLNNEKSILKSLNKSMSDVWEEFVWITYSIPNMIVKCGILKSIPILNKDEEDIVGKLYATLSLSFDPKKLGQIMLEFKQTGENTQNLRPDFDNMMYFPLPYPSLKITKFKAMSNKHINNCDPQNKQKSFDCIQRFIASNSNCKFSWMINHYQDGESLKPCMKIDELREHFELQHSILLHKLDNEIKAFGCLKRNCLENMWQAENMFDTKEFIPDGLFTNYNQNWSTLWFNRISDQVIVILPIMN